MWDPYGLKNKKHKRLTKLVKETLRSYRFILWKGGESNEHSLAMVFVWKVCVQSKEWDCRLCASPCP